MPRSHGPLRLPGPAIALATFALAGLSPIIAHALPIRVARNSPSLPRNPIPGIRNPAIPPSLTYTNTQFGFTVKLPDSWKGYTVVEAHWTGHAMRSDGTPNPDTVTGPQINIRHPLWTDSQPRQDIPIMVFTHAQWRLVTRVELVVSAAPIGPQELARNRRYVFALPPRYDFAELPGAAEVRDILAHDTVRPR